MNDETLTFYYYNDGLSRAERQQVASLLATDKSVAERYQAICRELDQLGSPAPVAPPEDMVARWHESLSSAVHELRVRYARKPQSPHLVFYLGRGRYRCPGCRYRYRHADL